MEFPAIDAPPLNAKIKSIHIDESTLFFSYNDVLYIDRYGHFEDVTKAHLGMLLQPGMSEYLRVPEGEFEKVFNFFKLLKKYSRHRQLACGDNPKIDDKMHPDVGKNFPDGGDDIMLKIYNLKLDTSQEILKDYFSIDERRFLTKEEKDKVYQHHSDILNKEYFNLLAGS